MKNLAIETRREVRVEFTPEQWELYLQPAEEAVYAAAKLNLYLESLVNSGKSKSEVLDSMYEKMRSLSSYGAADSEPIYFLETVLEEIYA